MFASAVLSLQMRTRVTSAESCLTGHVCISLGAHRAHGEFVHKRLFALHLLYGADTLFQGGFPSCAQGLGGNAKCFEASHMSHVSSPPSNRHTCSHSPIDKGSRVECSRSVFLSLLQGTRK
jgi:hypothetical protein